MKYVITATKNRKTVTEEVEGIKNFKIWIELYKRNGYKIVR